MCQKIDELCFIIRVSYSSHLQTGKLLPLRCEEELETFSSTWECETSDQECQHHHIGEDGREVGHLATAADSFPTKLYLSKEFISVFDLSPFVNDYKTRIFGNNIFSIINKSTGDVLCSWVVFQFAEIEINKILFTRLVGLI